MAKPELPVWFPEAQFGHVSSRRSPPRARDILFQSKGALGECLTKRFGDISVSIAPQFTVKVGRASLVIFLMLEELNLWSWTDENVAHNTWKWHWNRSNVVLPINRAKIAFLTVKEKYSDCYSFPPYFLLPKKVFDLSLCDFVTNPPIGQHLIPFLATCLSQRGVYIRPLSSNNNQMPLQKQKCIDYHQIQTKCIKEANCVLDHTRFNTEKC